MEKKRIDLTVVSPIYRGEKMLDELVARVKENVIKITDSYEIILVNDASPDNSWSKIEQLCSTDNHIKGINLSRNFGQHYAITAGLNYAKGEWVVVMDCDLQDRPEEIPNLYAKAQEGYDIVFAQRIERNDKFLKKLSSKAFHTVFNYLSGIKTDETVANFGIYKNKVINEFIKMKEVSRSFPSLINHLGFKISYQVVEHSTRLEGKSSYTLNKLLKLSFDVIISNSNKPLRLSVGFGFTMSFISILLAIYNILAKFIGIIQIKGYTTTVFSIWFVGGILLFIMGVLGLYIGKIFDQVKERQIYIVMDKVNID